MEITLLEPKMNHPAKVIPDAMKALRAFRAALKRGNVPSRTLYLVNPRASQING